MATQTYEQLIAGANKIKENELPETNTHNLVGEQLLQMTNKMQEDSVINQKKISELKSRLIKLKLIGADGSRLQVGDIYYNTLTKLLRKSLNDGLWETIPFIDGALYTYQGIIYYWNGTDLEPIKNAQQAADLLKLQMQYDVANNIEETEGNSIRPNGSEATDKIYYRKLHIPVKKNSLYLLCAPINEQSASGCCFYNFKNEVVSGGKSGATYENPLGANVIITDNNVDNISICSEYKGKISLTYIGNLQNVYDYIDKKTDNIITKEEAFNFDFTNAKLYVKNNNGIMLAGASIASPNNGWFELACKNKNVTPINKAVGATNSMYFANNLYNFGLGNTRSDLPKTISIEDFESHDALIIMYVHNVDAFTLSPLQVGDIIYTAEELNKFSAEDYETKGIIPYMGETTSGAWLPQNYKAVAYDYIIKKYMTLCYNLKKKISSKWYNVKSGKPVQIALCTYWDDSRRIISEAQRKLCQKWGFPLISFDSNIGFTKNKNNPATNKPNRDLYCNDGTHPLAGENEWIQKKMAAIVANSIITLTD